VMKPNISLEEFQEFNKKMYKVVDDRNYSNTDLASYVLRHVTQVLKAVRKVKYDNIGYHLCMAFSWSSAIANRFHIDLAKEIWKRFPGICPYCSGAPCVCKERSKERQLLTEKSNGIQPASLLAWQKMFAGIYPGNTIQGSAMHLAEEIGELNETVRNYLATHNKDWFDKIIEELVDVVSNLFGVANCLSFDLGAQSAYYFKHGCPKCHQNPCNCGYVSVDQPT